MEEKKEKKASLFKRQNLGKNYYELSKGATHKIEENIF
jgi:hypothetical protein